MVDGGGWWVSLSLKRLGVRWERGKSLGGAGREAAKRGRGSPGLPPGGVLGAYAV